MATGSSLVLANAVVTRAIGCEPGGASPDTVTWAFWIVGPISLGAAAAAAFFAGARKGWRPVACAAGAIAFAIAWTLAVTFVAVFTTSSDCFQ